MSRMPSNVRRALGKPRKSTVTLAAFFLVVVGVFSALSPVFRSMDNLLNILTDYSHIGLLAVGMTFPILLRGIDLSVGSTMGLAGMVAFDLLLVLRLPGAVAIPAVLLVGVLAGAVNSLLVVVLRLNPFIATLATMVAFRGLTYAISGRQLDRGLSTVPIQDLTYLGIDGSIGSVPLVFVYLLAFAILAHVLLTRTRLGRDIYAVGGNERAAHLAGIKVGRVTLLAYVLCGLAASLAALVITARLQTSPEDLGMTAELSAIAAAVIGGVSLQGGVGGTAGPTLGAFLIGTIYIGMTLEGVDRYVQPVVAGLILIGAVAYDRMMKLREDRNLLRRQQVAVEPSEIS